MKCLNNSSNNNNNNINNNINNVALCCVCQMEAEALARQKTLVFFEFEELLVALAMLVTPHRRLISTHAVEVLFDTCVRTARRCSSCPILCCTRPAVMRVGMTIATVVRSQVPSAILVCLAVRCVQCVLRLFVLRVCSMTLA